MRSTHRNRLGVLMAAVTALVLLPATTASAATTATATGKLVDKVAPAVQAECDGVALAVDLAGKRADLLREIGGGWGCEFETTGGGGGSAQRTIGHTTGHTPYGTRAASEAECRMFAAAIDIISEVRDNADPKHFLLLGNVLWGVYHIGVAMGCTFQSTR